MEDDIIWCSYCKEQIDENEDFVEKKGKYYHIKCWDTIKKKELNFD